MSLAAGVRERFDPLDIPVSNAGVTWGAPLERARLDGERILADVAPTALALLGIEQPPEMTGRSLLAGDLVP